MLVLRGSRLLGKDLLTELPDLSSWQLLWQMDLPTFLEIFTNLVFYLQILVSSFAKAVTNLVTRLV